MMLEKFGIRPLPRPDLPPFQTNEIALEPTTFGESECIVRA
jgi:hypothetical protein